MISIRRKSQKDNKVAYINYNFQSFQPTTPAMKKTIETTKNNHKKYKGCQN